MQFKILSFLWLFFSLFLSIPSSLHGAALPPDKGGEAHWITAAESQSATNTWICFRKDTTLSSIPSSVPVAIAVDSKYWLWINGKMVVFEGGLKRGPNPQDTYYDSLDLAPYLHQGKNSIAVLLWYFGKDGFSHHSSGKAGMWLDCPSLKLFSDRSWKARLHPAYGTLMPMPNYRLPESSILFDGRLDLGDWQGATSSPLRGFGPAVEIGQPGDAPWHHLVKRPIPEWKNSGLKEYVNITTLPGNQMDTFACKLPYNTQLTPYLKVSAPPGLTILLQTDHYEAGGTLNLRAGYITRGGEQEYESYGWLNGDTMFYLVPKRVKVLALKYRETGYNTAFAGSFSSSDPFLNRLWKKSQRTLYVTMRDSYMDCPDRERAQWIGDEVNEAGEAFYALDTLSHRLQRKGMYELMGWQRADNTLFAPVPAGNWNQELPDQILAAVGYYGFWNYYLNTGDLVPVADLYDGVKKYLDVWKLNDEGTVIHREGDWTWGDWGDNIDIELLDNAWYYLALKGIGFMAEALGKTEDAAHYRQVADQLKKAFNVRFWNGKAYRSPAYHQKTDDRAQALAVVSGLADEDKYPALLTVFKQQEHASPYMEKYVLEALFKMGDVSYGLERMKKRFGPMVNDPHYTTLFEGWGIGVNGYGGGTVNHAWSGGGLTILSQYLCGVSPLSPGYKTFEVRPRMGPVQEARATIPSVRGDIGVSIKQQLKHFSITVHVPPLTTCKVAVPAAYPRIICNGKPVKATREKGYYSVLVGGGTYRFEATR